MEPSCWPPRSLTPLSDPYLCDPLLYSLSLPFCAVFQSLPRVLSFVTSCRRDLLIFAGGNLSNLPRSSQTLQASLGPCMTAFLSSPSFQTGSSLLNLFFQSLLYPKVPSKVSVFCRIDSSWTSDPGPGGLDPAREGASAESGGLQVRSELMPTDPPGRHEMEVSTSQQS